jgi:CHRD domain
MRRTVSTVALGVAAAVVIAAIATNCGSDTTGPKGKTYVAANMNAAAENGGFTSAGTGTVTFVDRGTEIDWTLNLTNMTGVTLSHIHLGDASATGNNAGPVIINLFLPNGPTTTLNGEVAHGSFTNLNNANVSLDSVRVLFNNGHAYANVHTSAHGAGEIRAQIAPQ